MRYIEPHGHMVSRTTDDYLDMVTAGCAAVCEPAFWAGFDRSSVDGFRDYFRQLTEYEPARAAKYGLPHFCWLCINPKESEDVKLAEDVIGIIPEFLDRPTVLGIGEIGLGGADLLGHHLGGEFRHRNGHFGEKRQTLRVHFRHAALDEDALRRTTVTRDGDDARAQRGEHGRVARIDAHLALGSGDGDRSHAP
jgi:hypothetical protein